MLQLIRMVPFFFQISEVVFYSSCGNIKQKSLGGLETAHNKYHRNCQQYNFNLKMHKLTGPIVCDKMFYFVLKYYHCTLTVAVEKVDN